MDKHSLKEHSHGTPDFPVAIYNNTFDCQETILAPLHYHNEFELLVATRGSLSVQLEETVYTLAEGHGLFINSGILHIINSQECSVHGFIAIVFDSSMIGTPHDSSYAKYIMPVINGSLQTPTVLPEDICSKVLDIYELYAKADFGFELFVKSALTEIFYHLVQSSTSTTLPAPNAKSLLIKNILDYIEKNYTESISLQDMASCAHVSREYLCRVFNTMSDTTPVEYLNRYRIKQSANLLLHGNNTIADIAQSCGFNNSSYFNKLFSRYMGCTPTEYRKQNTTVTL